LDGAAKDLVHIAEQEVERLINVSRQTLAPHRQTKLPVVTRVAELLDDVCAFFRPKLELAKINVARVYETDGEVTIYPSELRQIFTNLIANAIDAMGKEGGQLRLAIEQAREHEITVKIGDTGCGIPSANLRTVFEPFFTTKEDKGTGIGLWVSKGLVDKLGGRIEVESSTSGSTGTCFIISLPVPRGASEPSQELKEQSERSA
jgi:signal transduction histidine kinase